MLNCDHERYGKSNCWGRGWGQLTLEPTVNNTIADSTPFKYLLSKKYDYNNYCHV